MTFRPLYFTLALVIFAIEVAIARGYIPGQFVRNSLGDVLVLALVYFFLRSVTTHSPVETFVVSLVIGFAVELLQYIHLADMLGLEQGSFLAIVIGNTFSLLDVAMYLLGDSLAVCLDLFLLKKWGEPSGSSRRGRKRMTR